MDEAVRTGVEGSCSAVGSIWSEHFAGKTLLVVCIKLSAACVVTGIMFSMTYSTKLFSIF